ncbi:putative uncharacterized protein DDB_G0290521 [Sitodiplosis mosellana]|uniref:putative uncharacterized protein DDB_G0290521 n=1 Tax=Sitodiplosis mosellana TaxID=263140 RepID=UPI0024442CEE|nr:putative uncharacterized protein DDB_G0290521 [Sitodiplosis mosellana]
MNYVDDKQVRRQWNELVRQTAIRPNPTCTQARLSQQIRAARPTAIVRPNVNWVPPTDTYRPTTPSYVPSPIPTTITTSTPIHSPNYVLSPITPPRTTSTPIPAPVKSLTAASTIVQPPYTARAEVSSDSDVLQISVLEQDLELSSSDSEAPLVIDDEQTEPSRAPSPPVQRRLPSRAQVNRERFAAITPFILPTISAPPRRELSPTFARFNPGLAAPPKSQDNSAQPAIVINNYYGVNLPNSLPQFAPREADVRRMTRGRFARFCKRSTQRQIAEALALRKEFKRSQPY